MYLYNLGFCFSDLAQRLYKKKVFVFNDKNIITYRYLNSKVNKLTNFLIDSGINKKDVICITGKKNLETYIGILACLKIGAIYSIIDDKSPIERLRRIFNKCKPKIIICEKNLTDKWKNLSKELKFDFIEKRDDAFKSYTYSYDDDNPGIMEAVNGDDPAYIMFTSGSTGFPKGAVMTHSNVINLINWSANTFQFSEDEILTNVNPMYFDNSVFDFYSSIFNGIALAPFDKEIVSKPTELITAIDEIGCTSWFSVPSMLIYLMTMKILTPYNMKRVKRIIFGGEGYPKSKLKNLFDLYQDRVDFYNVYGPTECTCICSSYRISKKDFKENTGLPPLGKIAKNFSYLILNSENNEVGANETGQLCLLGPNVGKGYYNDQARTDESFVQNPLNDNYAELIYKTGDLVRFCQEDGNIYFASRQDNQIKHMGYRIELEEIEVALSNIDYINESAVIHGYINGLSCIAAIISTENTVSEEKIRNDISAFLPGYMLPNRVYFKECLPKNPNGKIDRNQLKINIFETQAQHDQTNS